MYWQDANAIDASQYASLDDAIEEANSRAPGDSTGRTWGVTVYLPPNRHYVVQHPPVVIRHKRVRIVGGGPSSVVEVSPKHFVPDPAPDTSKLPDELVAELRARREIAIIEVRAGDDPRNCEQANAYDVSLEDFAIDGAALHAAGHAAVGVRLRSAGRMSRLRNLRISNCLRIEEEGLDSWNELGAGVSVENDANTCLLDSLDVTDCDEGVRLPRWLSRGAFLLDHFVGARDLLAEEWRSLERQCVQHHYTAAWFQAQYQVYEGKMVGEKAQLACGVKGVQPTNHVTIANSTIRNCRINGVRAEQGAVVKILSCSIEGCGRRGVAFSAVRNGIIEGCRFIRNGYRYVLPHDDMGQSGKHWNWARGSALPGQDPLQLLPLNKEREDWLVLGGDDVHTFDRWAFADKIGLDVGCSVGQVVLAVGGLPRDVPEQRDGVLRPVPTRLGSNLKVKRSWLNPGGHIQGAQVVGCSFDGGWRFDQRLVDQRGGVPGSESDDAVALGESAGALVAVLAREVAAANLIGCHFEGHRYTSILLRSYWWYGDPVNHRGATGAVVLGNDYADPLDEIAAPWVPEAHTHVLELRPPEEGWTRDVDPGPGVVLEHKSGACNLDYDRALWDYPGRPSS